MFSSVCEAPQNIEERGVKKRKSWSSAAARFSPYLTVSPRCLNASPAHGESRDVLKTFEESYDRLRSKSVIIAPGTTKSQPLHASNKNEEGKNCVPVVSNPNSGGDMRRDTNNNNLSYIGMIATAILQSKETKLTLSGIYSYMETHFIAILQTRPGWRNTVRHNLSLHDCFVKGEIAAEGKGRFWRIHRNYIEQFKCGKFNKNVLHNTVTPFYRSMANYRLPSREDLQGSFPLSFPASTWPNAAFYPLVTPSYTYPPIPYHRPIPPTTHLFGQRDYNNFQVFPSRQCPGDFCNGCTRARHMSALPCTSYGLGAQSLAIQNGTR